MLQDCKKQNHIFQEAPRTCMYFIRVSFFSVVWALLGLCKALVVDIDQEVLVEDCSRLVIVKVLKRCGPDPALWSA